MLREDLFLSVPAPASSDGLSLVLLAVIYSSAQQITKLKRNSAQQRCIHASWSVDVIGVFAVRVRESARKVFLKQCLKQGFLVHSEQIVKGGCGHWISSLLNCIKI